MRLTEARKAEIRDGLIRKAAIAFRAHGYDGVNLDGLMAASGVTRGAFYRHFASKAALFEEVVRREHPLLAMLEARDGTDANTLLRQLRRVLRGYLDPANHAEVFAGCTVAALTSDASRAAPEVRAGYEAGWQAIVEEMGRGVNIPAETRRAALTLASGAVTTAQAMASPEARADVLDAAWACVQALIPGED